MSRRLFIAFLFSLPFIWYAAFAYAAWQEPCLGGESPCPPLGNLPGPVWFLNDVTAEQQFEAGAANPGINISGTILATENIETEAKLIGAQAELTPTAGIGVYSIVNYAAGVAIRGEAIAPALAGAAIAGFGYGNPSLATSTGAWAGYFSDYLFAKWLCLDDGSDAGTDKDCIDSWDDVVTVVGGSDLWALVDGTGPSIYKTDVTGNVIIGANTMPTGANAASRLALVGSGTSGPRLYISDTTGNPEINFALSTAAGDHWAIYADTTGGTATNQLRFWAPNAAGAGVNQFAFTNEGAMIFYGWQAESFAVNVTITGNYGKIDSNVAGISNCRAPGCSGNFGSGTALTLTATPDATQYFGHWSGGSGASAVCNGVMTPTCSFTTTAASIPIAASFNTNPELKIIVTGGTVGVSNVDSSTGSLDCFTGSTCYYSNWSPTSPSTVSFFAQGGNITIWAGDCTSVAGTTTKTCVIGPGGFGVNNRTITATFETVAPTAPVFNPNTVPVSNIQSTSVNLTADVTDGGSTITTRGFCVSSTTANPTLALGSPTCQSAGSGAGSFGTVNRTGLTPGTLYHVTAYATNSIGTTYTTPDVTFTTLAAVVPPSIGSPTVGTITSSGATLGATVTSDGGASVTARGTCWATTVNPTTNCVSQGTGTGSFTHARTGMPSSTLIHYRGYATNSAGTSYTADATFTTLPAGGGYTLTLTISPAGGGTITCSTDGFSFGACAATYTSGTSLWLEATGLGFNDFSSWSAGSGSAAACSAAANRFTNPCTFTITSNSAVTAIFAPI